MKEKCGTCDYFDNSACRFNPPVVIVRQGLNPGGEIEDLVLTTWPQVHSAYDWCGKHPNNIIYNRTIPV